MKFSHRDLEGRDIRGLNLKTFKIGKYSIGVYNPSWSTYPEMDKYPRKRVLYLIPSIVIEYDRLSWDIKFFFLRFTFGVWCLNRKYFN
jgi:hypothetical protein